MSESFVIFPPVDHASSSSTHDSQYYQPPFDSSSFHMNPLSSHPPRTPRTSVLSGSSQPYSSSSLDGKEESERQVLVVEDGDVDESDDKDETKEPESRVGKEAVWREMFLTSDGRDKAFKLMQYSIRMFLIFHSSVSATSLLRRPTRPPWEADAIKRLESTASGFSFTRKLLLLFNWLGPLATIMEQRSVPYSSEQSTETSKKTVKPFLHAILHAPPPVLLELVNAVSDDVATFARMGLLGKRTGERAARFSDWCWFASTLIGLVENGVERQMIGDQRREVESRLYTESMTGATAKSKPRISKIDEKEMARLERQDYWLLISRAKLAMDLIFVSYDVFKIKKAKAPVQTVAGLAAAVLSSAKLYDRHKTRLGKALTF